VWSNTLRWMAEAVSAFAGRSGSATPVDRFAERLHGGLHLTLGLASDGSIPGDSATLGTLLGWLACRDLGGGGGSADGSRRSRELFDDWRLGPVVAVLYRGLVRDEDPIGRGVDDGLALLQLPPCPPAGR